MNAFLAALALLLQDQEPERPVQVPKPPEKEIVITGARREGDVLDVPSAVSVVSAEQIRKSGATDIVQVLRQTPGAFPQGANFGANDKILDLRGYNNGAGNGQRTLVLVDGRKTNNVASSATDWTTIPVENIERIEIVRGPAAALYGDTAMAGVVNIVTRKGGKDAGGQASVAGGTWSTWKSSAHAGGAQEKILWDVYVGAEGTHGWRQNSEYDGRNFTGRLEVPIHETLSAFTKLSYHEDVRERPGTLSAAQIDALGRDSSVTDGDEAEVEEGAVDLGLDHSLGEAGVLSLFVNYTGYRSDALFGTAFGPFFSDDETEVALFQLKHVLRPRLFGREAVFTTGLDASTEHAEGVTQSTGFPEDESDYRRRLLGLYEHVEIRPAPFLVLSGSIRYDRALLELDRDAPSGFVDSVDDQKAFDQWSPHAGITGKILEELSVYASYGRTFRFPNRDETIGFLVADPQLVPERAHSYELGTRARAGGWGSVSVSTFYMDVKDEIYFDPTAGFFGFGSNLNFDRVVHRGVEAEGRVSPHDLVELFASYALTDTEIKDADNPALEGKEYPVTPRHAGTVGTALSWEGLVLTLSARYVGSRILISDYTNASDELPDVMVYDARLAYSIERFTLSVAVYNLADREYFDSGGLDFLGNVRYNPAPERSFLAGAEVRF
jgi:iron complex outermembrane receptor protein